jgi:hypothetical protein
VAQPRGTGRTSSAACQLDAVSVSTRVDPILRASRQTTMTTARIGSTSSGLRSFPDDPLLEQAECDGGQRDGRQLGELPEHQRGERSAAPSG